MSQDDLFPGFRTETLPGDGADIFCRIGGKGPPVLFLHGFPQTHILWHKMAGELARHFTCIFADLRGYGDSSPASVKGPLAYSKRAMGADMVALMRRLGHKHFSLVGHDRGGRVAYRLALDAPSLVERVAMLDILPTYEYWQKLDRRFGLSIYHWMFLAQPFPLPETLIDGAPDFFLETKLAAWGKTRDLSFFDAAAFAAYRRQIRDPARVHAMCEDYRAGAGIDYEQDAADREAGKRIEVPALVLWGAGGLTPTGETPLHVWQRWASNVRGMGIDSGHYLPEENPPDTLAALIPFLKGE